MLGCALFFVKRLESFNACPHLAADVEVSLFLSLNEREMFTCSRLEIPHSLWCRGWGIFSRTEYNSSESQGGMIAMRTLREP